MTWISVKERLPEKRVRVLIWFRNPWKETEANARFGEISSDHWRPEGGNGNFDEWVTHWQPIPDPPNK